MSERKNDWDFAQPFIHEVVVRSDAIDVMGHVNNVQYLRWLEEAAWHHSDAIGLGWDAYQRLGCGVVATRHEIDYLYPAFVDQQLEVATWCTGSDQRLRLRRNYQVREKETGRTCVRGQTLWVCVDIKTGKPRRMPAEFVEVYQPVVGSPPFLQK